MISEKDRDDYPYIVGYGHAGGSFEYYIKDQVDLAREQRAPRNAIHPRTEPRSGKQIGDEWSTFDDIRHVDFGDRVLETMKGLGLTE